MKRGWGKGVLSSAYDKGKKVPERKITHSNESREFEEAKQTTKQEALRRKRQRQGELWRWKEREREATRGDGGGGSAGGTSTLF